MNTITIDGKTYTHGMTHNGRFHADDVCSTALLQLIAPNFDVLRVGNISGANESTLVFDIGMSEYDHHAEPRERRENGVPYAAFGKLWRVLAPQFELDAEHISAFDKTIVQPVDLTDNTGKYNPLSRLIESMNPTWNNNSDKAANRAFRKAVMVTQTMFDGWLEKAYAEMTVKKHAKEYIDLSNKGVATASVMLPTTAYDAEVVRWAICPSERGGWQALSLRKQDGHQSLFPEEWRGCNELPEGMTFCHAGGFFACFSTREAAIKTCQKFLN